MQKTKNWFGLGLSSMLFVASLAGFSSTTDTSSTTKSDATAKTDSKSTTSDETVLVTFVQDTDTPNGLNFRDLVTEQMEVETTLEDDGIASRIYKPEVTIKRRLERIQVGLRYKPFFNLELKHSEESSFD